jgi:hypothetical protein
MDRCRKVSAAGGALAYQRALLRCLRSSR